MANALKYGTKNITALKFDAPIASIESRYDFTSWTFNSQQPSSGITITQNKVIITKFKPNVPIITSNFTGTATDNTPKTTELSAITKNSYAKFTGLTANQSLLTDYTKQNEQSPDWTAHLRGLYFAPYRRTTMGEITVAGFPNWMVVYDDGTASEQLGNELTIRGEGGGYGQIARITDRTSYTRLIPSWTIFPENQDSHWQLGLGLYTSVTPDQSGFITLDTPIVFEIEDTSLTDPTTVEGFTAAVGEDTVYTKAKTYANVIQAYDFENEEHNTFVRPVVGKYISILSTWQGVSTAFVVDERAYENLYSHIRLPEITDLTALISSNYPVKFWGNIEQDGVHPTIWTSISNAFASASISDENFCQCLFANAATNNPVAMTVNIDLVDDDHYINMGDVLAACSAISEMHFNIEHGALKSLHEAFIQTRNLSQVTFNKQVNIADFSGTFEGSTLTTFPSNVAAGADWQTQLSEPTCLINFAADAAKLTTFGIANDNNPFVAVINPYCAGAFARSDIQTIEYVLDMKFVEPTSGAINYDGTIFNSVFGDNSALVSAKIANLNKGDWRLDGTASNGNYAGNLANLDATSVNYMLNNVFDLRRNSSQASYFENEFNSLNGWVASSGTKRPIVFEGWETCTLTKNLSTSGTMEVVLSLVNCTMSLTNGGSTTTIPAGTTQINLASGATTITFTKTNPGENMVAVLQLTSPFKAELTRNLSAANIYLPAGFGSKIDSSALTTANARGWTVYVGGNVYNG